MQTKSVTPFLILASAASMLGINALPAANAQETTKALPPITIVLFDRPARYDDDLPKVVVDTRDALRDNSRLEVLLFSPSSPSFILAARSSSQPLTLDNVNSAAVESQITSAVGGKYYIVFTPDEDQKKIAAQIVPCDGGSSPILIGNEGPRDSAADIAAKIISLDTADEQSAPAPPPPHVAAPQALPPALPTAPVVAQSDVSQAVPTASTPVSSAAAIPATPNNVGISNITVSVDGQPYTPPTQNATSVQPVLPTAVPPVPTRQTTIPILPPLSLPASQQPVTRSTVSAIPATPNSVGISNITVSVGDQPVDPNSPSPGLQPAPSVVVPPVTDTPLPIQSTITQPSAAPAASSAYPSGMPPIADMPVITGPDMAPMSGLLGTGADEKLDSDASNAVAQGDAAMLGGDALSAIGLYKNAISLAPRAMSPRLKLAQAYLTAGMKTQAVAEAKRALLIDPQNHDAKEFIVSQGDSSDPSNGVVLAQAQSEGDPSNPNVWISLGDAYWNANDPDNALDSYKRAADLDPSGVVPQTRLAKFYAARAEYDLSLAALQKSGPEGYSYALKIISSRSESLVGDLDDETDRFSKGTDTREQFYTALKATYAQAEGLADFVAKIVPPDSYGVSHLHRELSTKLIAQTAAVWIDYAETNNGDDKSQAASLEQYAINEMKTASIAEDLQTRVNH